MIDGKVDVLRHEIKSRRDDLRSFIVLQLGYRVIAFGFLDFDDF